MTSLKSTPNFTVTFLLLLAFCLLAGCQSWYKRGAGGAELAEDKQLCKSKTGSASGQAFSDCMQRAGWHQTGQAQMTTRKDRENPTVEDVRVASPDTTIDSASTEVAPDTPAPPDTSVSTVHADSVGAWFKFGAGTEQLKEDQALCRETSAQPETGFMSCMKSKGWRPVGSRPSPGR